MKFIVHRHKSKYRFEEYLTGFNTETGDALWSNDIKEAKRYTSQHIATIAACNANDHGDIYGDPKVKETQ